MIHTLPVQNGIGVPGGLEVRLQDGQSGWYPQVAPGFFYWGAVERYLFAAESNETIPLSAGLTAHTYTGDQDLRAAAKRGPIFLRDTSGQFVRATNCLRCFVSYVPTGATETMTVTLPSGSSLEMVTSDAGVEFRRAFLTEAIYQDPKTYLYNETTGIVTIARASGDADRSDPLFMTYRTEAPSLLFSEIRLVDSDGKVRVSLDNVANFSTYTPAISLPGSGTITASAVSGNVITPTSGIAEGTVVGVDYYVDRSFVLGFSGVNQIISVLSSVSGQAILSVESGDLDSYLDLGDTTHAAKVALNPRASGLGGGFLYIGAVRPAGEGLSSVSVLASPDHVIGRFSQPVKIVVLARDSEGSPLPDVPFSVTVSDGVSDYTPLYRDTSTDRKGQGFATWTPDADLATGTYDITVLATSATGVVVSGADSVVLADPLVFTSVSNDPKVHLHLSPNQDSQGLHDLYAYVVDQSGIPYLGEYLVKVTCELGKFIHNADVTSTELIGGALITLDPTDTTDLRGAMLLSCKYAQVPGDIIRAQIEPVNTSTAIYSFESTPLEVSNVL